MIVHINGILQDPASDYTITADALTFTTAPASGDVCTIRAAATAAATVEITPTAFMTTVIENDNSAAALLNRLGFSAYFQTIISSANASALKSGLSITDEEAVLDDIFRLV